MYKGHWSLRCLISSISCFADLSRYLKMKAEVLWAAISKIKLLLASGSLISIWKALRWQLKRWIFPVCHCKQVFGAVTWLGLWQEISTTIGQFIPLVSHIYFGMTGLAFRGTYFWLDYKGPGVTSSILLEGIPTRLCCFQVRANAFHLVCYL